MVLIEGDQQGGNDQLLQAQAHIWNHLFNFINSMSLKCAVELGIPDVIHDHGRPVTHSELASALRIPSDKAAPLRRLMRMLTHSGFFATQSKTNEGEGIKEELYLLTNSSRHLVRKNPTSVSPFLLASLDPILMNPWHSLSAWFRGAEPTPFHMVYGTNFWDIGAGRQLEFSYLFNEAMASDTRFVMTVVIKEHADIFRGLRSLVDVGGGNGTAANAIVEALPQVKCTVLDLPHVVASLPESKVIDFVVGDMFEYIPPADAVLLKWILHDWSDDDCVKILRLCKEAIPPKEEGGKVIIIDMVVTAIHSCHELTETQYFFDMLMMVHCGGKERDEKEWHKVFNDAGFSGYKITPGLGLRSIIEVYP